MRVTKDSIQELEMFRKLFWSMIGKGIYIAHSPFPLAGAHPQGHR